MRYFAVRKTLWQPTPCHQGKCASNYPKITYDARKRNFSSFYSTKGNWQLAVVVSSYGYSSEEKRGWGFQFSGSDEPMYPAAFAGPSQPYGLLTILGDPDENLTLRFKKL
jgi:hypothetical protein